MPETPLALTQQIVAALTDARKAGAATESLRSAAATIAERIEDAVPMDEAVLVAGRELTRTTATWSHGGGGTLVLLDGASLEDASGVPNGPPQASLDDCAWFIENFEAVAAGLADYAHTALTDRIATAATRATALRNDRDAIAVATNAAEAERELVNSTSRLAAAISATAMETYGDSREIGGRLYELRPAQYGSGSGILMLVDGRSLEETDGVTRDVPRDATIEDRVAFMDDWDAVREWVVEFAESQRDTSVEEAAAAARAARNDSPLLNEMTERRRTSRYLMSDVNDIAGTISTPFVGVAEIAEPQLEIDGRTYSLEVVGYGNSTGVLLCVNGRSLEDLDRVTTPGIERADINDAVAFTAHINDVASWALAKYRALGAGAPEEAGVASDAASRARQARYATDGDPLSAMLEALGGVVSGIVAPDASPPAPPAKGRGTPPTAPEKGGLD